MTDEDIIKKLECEIDKEIKKRAEIKEFSYKLGYVDGNITGLRAAIEILREKMWYDNHKRL